MSSTSIYTSSSVKNMKSTADAGKRRGSFRARDRCNARFARMSSCARRFFKHFNFKFSRTIRYIEEWWIPVSREIQFLFCCSSTHGAPVPCGVGATVQTKNLQPLPWNYLINLQHHNSWICTNFKLRFDQHCTPYLLQASSAILQCLSWFSTQRNALAMVGCKFNWLPNCQKLLKSDHD